MAGFWPQSRMPSGVRARWSGVSLVVKTAQSRGRTGRTLFRRCDSCSPQARPRGAQGCCGQASSVTSMSHYGLLHRTSGWQALMLSRWWAADARVERMGARPNRAVVVKTALTCDSYSHSSTVLEPRRERMKNSLVTMSARCWVVGGESGVLPRPLVYPRPAAG